MDQVHIYIMQILFVGGITLGSNSLDFNNKHKWIINIACYVLFILSINIIGSIIKSVYETNSKNKPLNMKIFTTTIKNTNKNHVMMCLGAVIFLILNDQRIVDIDFLLILIASLIVKYPEMEKTKSSISFGVGLATSYFEGYLAHVLPSDGEKFFGFEENINVFESKQGVVFPVKKLFVIVTKSLYNPPDLKHFNKSNRPDLPYFEVCRSLSVVERDVAGTKGRIYKNTAYKVYRAGASPVCVAAECATIIHTLYKVTKNRDLYDELSGLNKDEVVQEFISTLRMFIDRSPECSGKCELVYFDDADPEQNLADVLLERIREIAPNFEELIAQER